MGKALIFGIAGQDGSYLAEYLLSKGYEVYGTIRRNSTPEHQENRISGLDVTTYYSDLSDIASITEVLTKVMPDEIYNLAAQSYVGASFDQPMVTAEVDGIGVLRFLEIIRRLNKEIKFYQASTSEIYGNSINGNAEQNVKKSDPRNN